MKPTTNKPKIVRKTLEFLLEHITKDGLLFALTEYSSWDDFSGTMLGDAVEDFQLATMRVKEAIESACDERGIQTDMPWAKKEEE